MAVRSPRVIARRAAPRSPRCARRLRRCRRAGCGRSADRGGPRRRSAASGGAAAGPPGLHLEPGRDEPGPHRLADPAVVVELVGGAAQLVDQTIRHPLDAGPDLQDQVGGVHHPALSRPCWVNNATASLRRLLGPGQVAPGEADLGRPARGSSAARSAGRWPGSSAAPGRAGPRRRRAAPRRRGPWRGRCAGSAGTTSLRRARGDARTRRTRASPPAGRPAGSDVPEAGRALATTTSRPSSLGHPTLRAS